GRMGWLCDQVVKVGCYAIADFICPTPRTRDAFLSGGEAFVIFVDRIQAGAFADTNQMFVRPTHVDLHVIADGPPEYWAEQAMTRLRPVLDSKKPTALFVGRYQPFHEGHRALIVEGLKRVGQACIAVRTTEGIDHKNPFHFEYVKSRLEHGLREFEGQFTVVSLPNISHVFYGRDVGYVVERITLDDATENISATKLRKKLSARIEPSNVEESCRNA